ncbi:MAG: diguanylate cyclase [Rhodoferax sp.]|uniref:diguanylate cyclase n=1 Tax=Rhodoferax sp. TaxID=50421 RepID=UPI00262472BD|nr:sensor domain-containing diguanylate cyclase [Rhodoferax sp.]MDD5336707.1 diguanylate cyclase [Rhodoferax sp.]
MFSYPVRHSNIEAQAERQKTVLLYRNAGIAQSVTVANATLLAAVNVSLQASAGAAFIWWCLVVAVAAGRYLLARRFVAVAPNAAEAMTWRRRYIGGTAMMAATWGAGAVLFMWKAPDSALLFSGLTLVGMMAGAIPLLAPVPAAFATFAVLVSVPMSAVVLLQAHSALHWAFGTMGIVFLFAMLASARYLHETLDVAIRLGLEQGQLAESQRILTAAVEQSNSSIVVTDADASIIFVNAGFSRATGYSPEEAIGQNPRILKSGKTPKKTYEELWATIASGRPWQGEIYNKKKNGELYWEAASISPVVDAAGRIAHYVAVKDDITQRKQAETALQEQKNFLSTVLANEPECVNLIGTDGTLLQMNNAGMSMLEVDSIEAVNACGGLVNFVLPEHRSAFNDLAERVLAGETGMLEFQIEGKQGTRRWLEIHAAPLRDAAGKITHLLGVTRDVSRKREAEQRLTLALRGADLALTDWNVPGNTLVFGEGWAKLLGHRPQTLHPHVSTLADLVHPGDASAARDALIHHLKNETPFFEVEVRMRHDDGRWIWVLARGMAVERDSDGQPLRVAGTGMDITHRKAMEQELKRLATTDPLTGVANRRHFIELFEMELARIKRSGESAAFLMVDIDRFKNVNDSYGHAIGDTVLQHLAELSRLRLRRTDLFGRLGGEEFGVLLPSTGGPEALQFAEEFRRHVAVTPAPSSKGEIPFTISIGVAEFKASDRAPDSILARADAALYRAKDAGRNRVETG